MWLIPENKFKYIVYDSQHEQTQFYSGTGNTGHLNGRLSDKQLNALELLFGVPPVVVEEYTYYRCNGKCGDIDFSVYQKVNYFVLMIQGTPVLDIFQAESFAFGYVAQEAYRRKMKQDNTFWAE